MTIMASNEKLPGGLQKAFQLEKALVAQNPSGLANGEAYAPLSAGIIGEATLDTEVTSSSQYVPLQGVPNTDTQPSNCVLEFAGGIFINAASIQRLNDATLVQGLYDARRVAHV